MKRIYNRFRIALMAFAFGLAAVYISDRLPMLSGEVPVDLPTTVSADVIPVFVDNSRSFTREMNCGKEPADAQARLECSKERLFGHREMSLYAKYEINRDPTGSLGHDAMWENVDDRRVRDIVWRHWKGKTRAHVAVRRLGSHWKDYTHHYFIEPMADGSWIVSSTYTYSMLWYVDGVGTEVIYVDPRRSYNKARWKTATADDVPYYHAPGTRYLEFENITGDTVTF